MERKRNCVCLHCGKSFQVDKYEYEIIKNFPICDICKNDTKDSDGDSIKQDSLGLGEFFDKISDFSKKIESLNYEKEKKKVVEVEHSKIRGTLIIAYQEKDKVCVNQLRKLLEIREKVDVATWEEKVWINQETSGLIDHHVLLIDNVKGGKSVLPVIDKKFEQYGIVYGWAGTRAVISIDQKALWSRDAYDAFLKDLRSLNNSCISEYERGQGIKKDAKLLLFGKEIFMIKLLTDLYKDHQMVRQQMLLFAVIHFYCNGLKTFMEI